MSYSFGSLVKFVFACFWEDINFMKAKPKRVFYTCSPAVFFSIGWIIDSSVFCVSPIHITYIKQQPFLSIQKQAGEVLSGKNLPACFLFHLVENKFYGSGVARAGELDFRQAFIKVRPAPCSNPSAEDTGRSKHGKTPHSGLCSPESGPGRDWF